MQHVPTPPAARPPLWLLAVLALFSLAIIVAPLAIVRTAPAVKPAAAKVVRPQRVVPKTMVPEAEPVIFQTIDPRDAQAYNAGIPFSTAPNPAARPFHITGDEDSRARALDCLAAAVIYEAGDDTSGEKAVAQVVLNRVRHPAFPSSVCGVVFQGAERTTGCQFTFTCDGALARTLSAAAWDRARDVARAALNGAVDARVGHATHYHTDWVVPYWSSSLDKITEVHTHLFFRWSGWWGTPPAFRKAYAGVEPVISKIARLSPMHGGLEGEEMVAATLVPPLPGGLVIPNAIGPDSGTFLIALDPKLTPEQLPALAARACGARSYCKLMAWSNRAIAPASLPVTPQQQRAMSFSYLRDRDIGFEKALWNCTEYKGLAPNQCMRAQLSLTLQPIIPSEPPAGGAPPLARTRPALPDPLAGVRRKGEEPAPAPSPTPAAKPTRAAGGTD